MADQALASTPDEAPAQAVVARTFPPKGQALITGINRVGLWSLYIKEIRRFLSGKEKFKKNPEGILKATAAYYEELTRK